MTAGVEAGAARGAGLGYETGGSAPGGTPDQPSTGSSRPVPDNAPLPGHGPVKIRFWRRLPLNPFSTKMGSPVKGFVSA